jgi:hypothetical protein
MEQTASETLLSGVTLQLTPLENGLGKLSGNFAVRYIVTQGLLNCGCKYALFYAIIISFVLQSNFHSFIDSNPDALHRDTFFTFNIM